jgi:hypothetical protein
MLLDTCTGIAITSRGHAFVACCAHSCLSFAHSLVALVIECATFRIIASGAIWKIEMHISVCSGMGLFTLTIVESQRSLSKPLAPSRHAVIRESTWVVIVTHRFGGKQRIASNRRRRARRTANALRIWYPRVRHMRDWHCVNWGRGVTGNAKVEHRQRGDPKETRRDWHAKGYFGFRLGSQRAICNESGCTSCSQPLDELGKSSA